MQLVVFVFVIVSALASSALAQSAAFSPRTIDVHVKVGREPWSERLARALDATTVAIEITNDTEKQLSISRAVHLDDAICDDKTYLHFEMRGDPFHYPMPPGQTQKLYVSLGLSAVRLVPEFTKSCTIRARQTIFEPKHSVVLSSPLTVRLVP